jgi:peroxiredoxin
VLSWNGRCYPGVSMRVRMPIVALSTALVLALALVLLLGRRLDALGEQYNTVRRLASKLHAGSVVPAFRAATLNGDSLTIGEAAGPDTRQVLFVLTTTCPYCKATLPVWARLADSLTRLPNHSIQVIAISLDSIEATRRYVEDHGLSYPVITFPSPKLRRLYRAGTVPETVVLDKEGRVLHARTGLLDRPAVLDSIYKAATLPLRSSRPAAGARPAPPPSR